MSAAAKLSAQGYPGYSEQFAERVLVRQCATGEQFAYVIADLVQSQIDEASARRPSWSKSAEAPTSSEVTI